ncbi:LysE family translocator [Photobacterium sanctipauli]|uniref:LysE family translocator n=1 Tax=Photobacterium sanctipauli TaxID=1342794 RepID=A0A2T3P0P0_9GAMM|nr:LysE family translocator [Photobacterium sanctipauli]PSW22091.1 LysE family translocator [Photobacterium sanctipauli]
MSAELMVAFILFSISISITPGAGNIALLGISSRYGFSATVPFVFGNAFGVIVVLAGSSVGLVTLLTVYPDLYFAMKLVGAAYLLYLAWSIATLEVGSDVSVSRSGFSAGVLIQILNPKSWVASLTVFSQFVSTSGNYLVQVMTIITIMIVTGVMSMFVWAYFGTMLKRLLQSPRQMVLVNRCLGGSLALVALFMLNQTA